MVPQKGFHTWNYRIVEDRNGSLSIHEVYYDDMGVATDWTSEGVPPYGETMMELNTAFNMMQEAFYEPILKEVKNDDSDPTLEEHPYYNKRIVVGQHNQDDSLLGRPNESPT